MNIRKLFSKVIYFLVIKLKERTFKGKVKYLFFNNGSKDLLIVFSGFSGEQRRYNYVKGLWNINVDKLYILDTFAYMGSYYLYENGNNGPEKLVKSFIDKILMGGGKSYEHVYMAGSSKGGTAAIYYGVEYNADAILSGACQWNLGTYLHRPDHEKIFLSMMGPNASDKECRELNEVMPNQIKRHNSYNGVIHLLYSKKDLTYERQIVDLIKDLKANNLRFIEKEEFFEKHSDVGYPFLAYLRNFLLTTTNVKTEQ